MTNHARKTLHYFGVPRFESDTTTARPPVPTGQPKALSDWHRLVHTVVPRLNGLEGHEGAQNDAAGDPRSEPPLRAALLIDEIGPTTVDALSSIAETARPSRRPVAFITAAPLSVREGFLLAMVDGVSTVREILDACGLDEAEARAIFARLRRLNLVTFAT